jgi:hypothetical protein
MLSLRIVSLVSRNSIKREDYKLLYILYYATGLIIIVILLCSSDIK